MSTQLYRLLAVWLFLLFGCVSAFGYDYPFTDPYTATVIGTPAEYAEALPAEPVPQVDSIVMFPNRRVPDVLWNLGEFHYSSMRQDGPAPLIFLIAGTGSSFRSGKMVMMAKAFYRAGFHVVSLSSPTHPNFIVAASAGGVPGNLEEDSVDLYRLMQAVWRKLQGRMEATGFYLTGYSLGGAHAAFISQLDEREQVFNFQKVLMINPPVSLYTSVNILDAMLERNIPGGLDNFGSFYRKVIRDFGETYAHGDKVEFNDEFLYEAYAYHSPENELPMAALIGVSFRVFCENMVFTSDVMTRAGYVVPENLELDRYDRLTPYIQTLSRLTFNDYFKGLFMPHFRKADPGLTEEEMIRRMSLRSLEHYLRNTAKIGLLHNRDDIILHPGEIEYLQDLFGDRALIYPHGGHLGNMSYPENVAAMIAFFATPVQRQGERP